MFDLILNRIGSGREIMRWFLKKLFLSTLTRRHELLGYAALIWRYFDFSMLFSKSIMSRTICRLNFSVKNLCNKKRCCLVINTNMVSKNGHSMPYSQFFRLGFHQLLYSLIKINKQQTQNSTFYSVELKNPLMCEIIY